MDHELVQENSNSPAVYTLSNTIVYLKAIEYLNIRQADLLNGPGTVMKGVQVSKIENRMLYYNYKVLKPLFWKLKTL